MFLDECITILTEHSKYMRREWLTNEEHKLMKAIDYAIEELHRLKGLEK
jgi:hypothetical protein